MADESLRVGPQYQIPDELWEWQAMDGTMTKALPSVFPAFSCTHHRRAYNRLARGLFTSFRAPNAP